MPVSRRRLRDGRPIRALVWLHRWLGVATCLLFALWFASGAVLLFVPFPSLPAPEAMAMAAPLDIAAVAVAPARAAALAGPVAALRLRMRAGRPAYLADASGAVVVIDARTGGRPGPLTAHEAAATIFRSPGGKVAGVAGPFGYDQWVVHDRFDPLRPFYRVDMADAAATRYYVSATTGDVVQRTTRWQRGWNWPGAVLHWAYVTPLRASFAAWDRSVWWVSLVALLVAAAGMVLGVWRTMQVRRAGRRGLTWFRAPWLRWHHLGGLFAGVFVLTWIFSGWLSMDHGRLFSRGRASEAQQHAYAGLTMADAAAAFTLDRLRHMPRTRELRFIALAGTPLAVVVGRNGHAALASPTQGLLSRIEVDRLLDRAVADAWPAEPPPARAPEPVAADSLAALAEGMPPSAERIAGAGSRPPVYVDGEDGRILTVMTGGRLAYAWLYYAMHSFNVPGLASRPTLRAVVVIVPLVAGLAFSLTGVVLGWRRLRRGRGTISTGRPRALLAAATGGGPRIPPISASTSRRSGCWRRSRHGRDPT